MLDDSNSILINTTNKTVNVGINKVDVNFDTALIHDKQFNYTVKILDASGNLIYRNNVSLTQLYNEPYETGTNITNITDINIDNTNLSINVTVNSSKAETLNITVVLAYNSSTISATEEKTLVSGLQNVSILFDNETLKSTHYNGSFNISTVIISQKVINTGYKTAEYNYETFAKTSYIINSTSFFVDTNNNNLSDYLGFNFTMNIKEEGTYIIYGELYDLYDNYIANFTQGTYLTVGEKYLEVYINGSEIYITRIDGPYKLLLTKLSKDGNTDDILYDMHVTNNTFYTDFEPPERPDLTINLNVAWDSVLAKTNLTFNITNKGLIPAFNIFIDVFDNSTYAIKNSVFYLPAGESYIFNTSYANTSDKTYYIAIADFYNYVDEFNESNNVYTTYNAEADETSGRIAIENGITTSVLTDYIIYTDQQIYVRYLNNIQMNGTFDKVVIQGNQTWAFNYNTTGEYYTGISSLYNNTLVIWKNQSLSSNEITNQVKSLIDSTKW
ncbi:hypothetical protein J4434_08915 [Candidatus Woesearchaeota archaeon]|nr:hypothetical protein [Candidatus Woesearchaeota archaeon]